MHDSNICAQKQESGRPLHEVTGRRKCLAAAYSRCGARALLEEPKRFPTGIGRPFVLMLMRSAAARHDEYSYTKSSSLSPQSAPAAGATHTAPRGSSKQLLIIQSCGYECRTVAGRRVAVERRELQC